MEKKSPLGLPNSLRARREESSLSMEDVRVHYNSSKPVQLEIFQYTQKRDTETASGQEKHLPHDPGHLVPQRQGRVRPPTEIKAIQEK